MTTPTMDHNAVRRVLRSLEADSYVVCSVFDGDNMIPVDSPDAAFAEIIAVDDAYLFMELHGDPVGWMRFVTVAASPMLDSLTEGW